MPPMPRSTLALALAFLALSAGGAPLAAQESARGPSAWEAADARALSAPSSLRYDPAALAAYLTQGAAGDTERARAIFRWLAENIAYDYAARDNQEPVRPEEVLVRGRAVCEGYAGAFELLGRLAGLEVVSIHGYAKGHDWGDGAHFERTNHAWNAVRIAGAWRLIDATWGAGYVRDGQFVKQLEDYFFMPAPEALAFTHLPEDPGWALVPRPLSLRAFEAQPVVRAAFFRAGFSASDAAAALREPGAAALVEVFMDPDLAITVTAAPAQRTLAAGQRYQFRLSAPPGTRVALVNGGRWSYLPDRGGVFAGSMLLRRGALFLVAGSGPRAPMRTVLRYEAR